MKGRLSDRRLVRLGTLTAAFSLPIACGQQPAALDRDSTVEGRTQSGVLEQRLSLRLVTSNSGERILEISTRVVNRGTAPTTVTLRTCLFLQGDVQSNAQLVYHEPFIACGAVSMTGTLAPGQSEVMQGSFAVRSGPGTYQVSVRHALNPELRTTAAFTVP